jgi:regulator of PEP synthase PpsR (kinase-PPPase family)
MLDCHHGDVYEAIEEMYGMIWYLAEECLYAERDYPPVNPDRERAELIETARKKYLQGLYISPTKRFESPRMTR